MNNRDPFVLWDRFRHAFVDGMKNATPEQLAQEHEIRPIVRADRIFIRAEQRARTQSSFPLISQLGQFASALNKPQKRVTIR